MTPPTSSGFGTTMRTSRKSYSRKTLTHVSPGSMISSSTSDSDNSLHSLYFTSYHGLINYPQKIPAQGNGSLSPLEICPTLSGRGRGSQNPWLDLGWGICLSQTGRDS